MVWYRNEPSAGLLTKFYQIMAIGDAPLSAQPVLLTPAKRASRRSCGSMLTDFPNGVHLCRNRRRNDVRGRRSFRVAGFLARALLRRRGSRRADLGCPRIDARWARARDDHDRSGLRHDRASWPHGERSSVFPRHWSRVTLHAPPAALHPSRLLIESHGRACEVGRFLTEDERRSLAVRLKQLVGNVNESPAL